MSVLGTSIVRGTLEEVKKYLTAYNIEEARRIGLDLIVLATLRGEKDIMEFVLTSNRFHIKCGSKSTAVMLAAEDGNEAILRLLLKSGVYKDVFRRGSHPLITERPLQTAAIYGHAGAVKVFLEFGFSVDEVADPPKCIEAEEEGPVYVPEDEINYHLSICSLTALEYACLLGHVEVVRVLLDNDPNSKTHSKQALHLAAAERKYSLLPTRLEAGRHADVVQILLEKGFDVDAVENEGDGSPLCCAAKFGSVSTVKILLEAGANTSVTAGGGRTPLHLAAACKHNQDEIVKLLIHNGADVFAVDANKSTALHYAVENGCAEVVKRLLECGIDLNSRNSDEETPLHEVAKSPEIAEMLFSYGARPDVFNSLGLAPFHYACAGGHIEVFKLLLKKSAFVDLRRSDEDTTPLMVAVSNSKRCYSESELEPRLEICRTLLRAGADPNAYSRPPHAYIDDTDPPLFDAVGLATHAKETSMTDLLVSFGADVNYVNRSGGTVLEAACSEHSSKNIAALLEYGAQFTPSCFDLLATPGIFDDLFRKVFIPPMDPFEFHFIKMKAASLCSGEVYVKDPANPCNMEPTARSEYKAECMKEVEKLKQHKIGERNISHYDLLRKPSPVYRWDLADAVRPLVLEEPTHLGIGSLNLEGLQREYPIYWRLLKINIERGLKRGKLFEDGHRVMKRIPDVDLPLSVVDQILTYLTDQELANLRDVLPTGSSTNRKRKRACSQSN